MYPTQDKNFRRWLALRLGDGVDIDVLAADSGVSRDEIERIAANRHSSTVLSRAQLAVGVSRQQRERFGGS